jgi:alanine transaminase
MDVEMLNKANEQAKREGTKVRGLVVINPGNPTGQCLEKAQMREIVQFCSESGIALMADEVYQTNVYHTKPFYSFKQILGEMKQEEKATGSTTLDDMTLVSFHSVSKGFLGECGRRGGYMEIVGMDADVQMELYKLASVTLCSNVDGQIMTGLMTNPPTLGDESYELYKTEWSGILGDLKSRSQKIRAALGELDGVTCNVVEGALYAFPSITLPPKAIEAAKKEGKTGDAFYCIKLLDATGVVVVPGSGFGQKPGTFHFRTTILPPDDQMETVIEGIKQFHKDFMNTYSS